MILVKGIRKALHGRQTWMAKPAVEEEWTITFNDKDMAFYKKQKMNGKWYPRSFTVGTMDTDQVAERLSRISTVSKGDT